MATMDELERAAANRGSERHDEREDWYDGRRITTWTNGVYWFAEATFVTGVGVGESRDDVLALAKSAIDNS